MASIPSSVLTDDETLYKEGLPLYLAKDGGGCLLLAGFLRGRVGNESRLLQLLGSLSADTACSKAELVDLEESMTVPGITALWLGLGCDS